MKRSIYISALAAGCGLLLAASSFAAEQKMGEKEHQKQGYSQQQEQQGQQQARQQEQQKSQYARQLITPDQLNGMKIQNQQGEEIGSVDKVVLDSKSGQIAYVVVTSGGFWGVGGEKAVIPWKAVKLQQPPQAPEGRLQEGQPVLVVNVSKEELKNAPQGDIEQILDRRQAEQIHEYYGVAPYWEGQEQQQMEEQQPMKEQQQQKEEQKRME